VNGGVRRARGVAYSSAGRRGDAGGRASLSSQSYQSHLSSHPLRGHCHLKKNLHIVAALQLSSLKASNCSRPETSKQDTSKLLSAAVTSRAMS
jgi:hypothetical protein